MFQKNLGNAHIINKSYIVNRKSYMATAFPNAVAMRFALDTAQGMRLNETSEKTVVQSPFVGVAVCMRE